MNSTSIGLQKWIRLLQVVQPFYKTLFKPVILTLEFKFFRVNKYLSTHRKIPDMFSFEFVSIRLLTYNLKNVGHVYYSWLFKKMYLWECYVSAMSLFIYISIRERSWLQFNSSEEGNNNCARHCISKYIIYPKFWYQGLIDFISKYKTIFSLFENEPAVFYDYILRLYCILYNLYYNCVLYIIKNPTVQQKLWLFTCTLNNILYTWFIPIFYDLPSK